MKLIYLCFNRKFNSVNASCTNGLPETVNRNLNSVFCDKYIVDMILSYLWACFNVLLVITKVLIVITSGTLINYSYLYIEIGA